MKSITMNGGTIRFEEDLSQDCDSELDLQQIRL